MERGDETELIWVLSFLCRIITDYREFDHIIWNAVCIKNTSYHI